MIPGLLAQPLALALGTVYPAYASYKAVRTKNVREYVKWMMYWIVFAAFTCLESVADIFVAFWFPFYYELKLLILLWLVSPVSRGSLGSSLVYRAMVHPHLVRREKEIDRVLARLHKQSYNTVLGVGSRTFQAVAQTAMQVALQVPDVMAQVAATAAANREDVVDGVGRGRFVAVEHQALQTSPQGASEAVAQFMDVDDSFGEDVDQHELAVSTDDILETVATLNSSDEDDNDLGGRADLAGGSHMTAETIASMDTLAGPSRTTTTASVASTVEERASIRFDFSSDDEMQQVVVKPTLARKRPGRTAKAKAKEAIAEEAAEEASKAAKPRQRSTGRRPAKKKTK